MTDVPKMNLRQKLVKVYSAIDHVEKAGTNSKQNYKFVRAADVLRVVRDAFAALGIYAETNYESLGTYDIKTNSGGNMHTATVKATIVLYDTDSDETKTISGLGDGADGGDKGIYKAQTGATKNALRNGFLLPDEADPEADESVDSATDQPRGGRTGAYGADMPDFRDAQHVGGAPRSASTHPAGPLAADVPGTTTAPAPAPAAPQTSTAALSAANAQATAPSTPPAEREPGDEPVNMVKALLESLPTEAELSEFRKKFAALGDELTTNGKLKASKGMPVNRKLVVFLLSITKAESAKVLTKSQWEDFFKRAEAAKALENGLVGLAKLVNKANGIEETKK